MRQSRDSRWPNKAPQHASHLDVIRTLQPKRNHHPPGDISLFFFFSFFLFFLFFRLFLLFFLPLSRRRGKGIVDLNVAVRLLLLRYKIETGLCGGQSLTEINHSPTTGHIQELWGMPVVGWIQICLR